MESAYHERLLGLLGGKEARTLKAKSLNVSTLDVQMAQVCIPYDIKLKKHFTNTRLLFRITTQSLRINLLLSSMSTVIMVCVTGLVRKGTAGNSSPITMQKVSKLATSRRQYC